MLIYIGIDIGQRVDPTALAVTELQWREVPVPAYLLEDGAERTQWEDHYVVRHLERLPLGTPYPQIVERLAQVCFTLKKRVRLTNLRDNKGSLVPKDAALFKVYADATGVGQPVLDMLKQAGVKVTGCYFTHGDKRLEQRGDDGHGELRINLGKAYLVARLQAVLQSARLHLPRTEEAQALAQELLDYEIRVDEKANDTYGAFRVGAHDDLVTALGLCVQERAKRFGALGSTPHKAPQLAPDWAGGEHVRGLPRLPASPSAALSVNKWSGELPPFAGLNGIGGEPR